MEDCLQVIFNKNPITWMPHLQAENLRLNEHYPLSEEKFKALINNFKEAYHGIEANEVKDVSFFMDEKFCQVKGTYTVTLALPLEEVVLPGTWAVNFELDDLGYWDIVNVQIEGINF